MNSSFAITGLLVFVAACDAQNGTGNRAGETSATDNYDEKLRDALDAIQRLETSVKELNAEIGSLSASLDAEKAETRSLQGVISSLREEIYAIKFVNASLDDSVDILNADMLIAKAAVETNSTYITEREDAISLAVDLQSYIRVEETDIIFEGANLHVRSGSGRTDGEPNGLGNIVIGYNETLALCQFGSDEGNVCIDAATDCEGSCHRVAPPITTGSHNLIIGPRHDYSSHSCLIAGDGGDATEAMSFALSLPESRGDRSSGETRSHGAFACSRPSEIGP